MSRLPGSCFSVFWLAAFVSRSSEALPRAAAGQASAILSLLVFMLAAMLFLRVFLTVWNGEAAQSVETLRAAVAIAILSVGLDMLLPGGGANRMAAPFMQVAALGATYIVLRMEARGAPPETERHRHMARHLARAAGFRATMTRLSGGDAARTDG